mgnify:CR=1 FL=1
MSKALPKTNAMRQLDAAKIPYEVLTYEVDENDLSGTHIADEIGLPYGQILISNNDKPVDLTRPAE